MFLFVVCPPFIFVVDVITLYFQQDTQLFMKCLKTFLASRKKSFKKKKIFKHIFALAFKSPFLSIYRDPYTRLKNGRTKNGRTKNGTIKMKLFFYRIIIYLNGFDKAIIRSKQ